MKMRLAFKVKVKTTVVKISAISQVLSGRIRGPLPFQTLTCPPHLPSELIRAQVVPQAKIYTYIESVFY